MPTSSYSPTSFSGTYQFSEKFSGIPADYTKLKSIKVSGYNRKERLYGSSYTSFYNFNLAFDEDDLIKFVNEGVTLAEKCDSNGVCINISYNIDEQCAMYEDCLVGKYGDDYREKVRLLANGFNVSISGLLDATDLYIEYVSDGVFSETTFEEKCEKSGKHFLLTRENVKEKYIPKPKTSVKKEAVVAETKKGYSNKVDNLVKEIEELI